MTDTKSLIEWFCGNDTGTSSKTIAAVMSGCDLGKVRSFSHPLDPSDLGRCLRLLMLFPEWKERMHLMSGVSEKWDAAVQCWDEISASMDDEVGIDWSKGKSAPKTYNLMKMRGL